MPKATPLAGIDDLRPDPHNANKGTDRGRAMVAKSLEECGAGRSILADRDGTVIAGNKTLEAARKLGLPVRVIETDGEELVVVRRTDLSIGEEKGRRLAYLDNKASEIGLDWDMEQALADLAAEQTGRTCYGMELEPKYVAVTLERLAGLGLEPTLLEG